MTREKLLPGAKTSGTTPLPAVPGAQTSGTAVKWVDCSGLKEAAISTAVRKVRVHMATPFVWTLCCAGAQ